MSPDDLRALVKQATEAASAEADEILHQSDRAEALADAAIEMLLVDSECARKLADRAVEIGGDSWVEFQRGVYGDDGYGSAPDGGP